jgi:hypothetical protein
LQIVGLSGGLREGRHSCRFAGTFFKGARVSRPAPWHSLVFGRVIAKSPRRCRAHAMSDANFFLTQPTSVFRVDRSPAEPSHGH